MEQNEKTAEILNDLIKINNDRIEGYNKAISELDAEGADLKVLFEGMKAESAMYKQELANMVTKLGEDKATGTRLDGKIYRAWMDVKATFSGNTRKAVLESCEFGEDAAQKAYRAALAPDSELSADGRQLVAKQQTSLKSSHDKIKQLRDSTK